MYITYIYIFLAIISKCVLKIIIVVILLLQLSSLILLLFCCTKFIMIVLRLSKMMLGESKYVIDIVMHVTLLITRIYNDDDIDNDDYYDDRDYDV